MCFLSLLARRLFVSMNEELVSVNTLSLASRFCEAARLPWGGARHVAVQFCMGQCVQASLLIGTGARKRTRVKGFARPKFGVLTCT